MGAPIHFHDETRARPRQCGPEAAPGRLGLCREVAERRAAESLRDVGPLSAHDLAQDAFSHW